MAIQRALSGAGQPIDPAARIAVEHSVGLRLGDVRLHTGPPVRAVARGVGAAAFTLGRGIGVAVAPGEEVPEPLLRHELVHVAQQLAGGSAATGEAERQAKRAGHDLNAVGPLVGTEATPAFAAGDWLTGQSPKGPQSITWEEAWQTIDAIGDIIEIRMEIRKGLAYDMSIPASHKDVPARWQPLLTEWYLIAHGRVRYPDGMLLIYRGDFLAEHIDRAEAETAPLVRALVAEGDELTAPWLEEHYTRKIAEFRKRALTEAVSADIESTAKKGVGGAVDIGAIDDLTQLKLGTNEALKMARAVVTVATRTTAANVDMLKKLDEHFAHGMGRQNVPRSLETTRAMTLQNSLAYVQGGLNLVQAIVNVSDPKKRFEMYRTHQAQFGVVGGDLRGMLGSLGRSDHDVAVHAEMLKNLGQFVSGAAAVAGAGTYAVAAALGKADLAAKALSLGKTGLGHVNVALNVFGAIHGLAVLCDKDATGAEKLEAGVEAGSGGLGLAGKLVPALAPYTAAATTSLLVNFYAFKGVLGAAAGAYSGLMSVGLNMCFEELRWTARTLSGTGMKYAAALDLAGTTVHPARAFELVRQTDGLRTSLVWEITTFMRSAVKRGGNKDPGTYEILRKRFLPFAGKLDLSGPEQIISTTARLLELIASCFTDAQAIYQEEIEYTWEHHTD